MAIGKATRARKSPGLSELEAVVLGLVWVQGPCTAYAVRLTVRQSLSSQWSGSAGAVYPAVTRLEERGLIRSRPTRTGRRRSMELQATPRGIRALQAWLGPPVDAIASGIPADPLRTRLRFLEVLPLKQQIAFVTEARDRLAADLRSVEADHRRALRTETSPFQRAMVRGALLMTRARLRAIDELARELSA